MTQPEQQNELNIKVESEIEQQEQPTDKKLADEELTDEERLDELRARRGPSLVDVLRGSRLLLALATLVAVQLVLVAVVFLLPRGSTAATDAPLLPDLSVDAANALTIADDTGESITLAREGDGWVLPDADNYPANGGSIEALIEQIGELEADTVIAESAGSHARLQVGEEDFARRVDLSLDGGDGETLFIGSTAGGGASHMRAGDSDTVYLSDGISAFDVNATAAAWIDPTFFSVAQPDVQMLTLTNISGTVELVRGADGAFTLIDLTAGETVDEASLSSLLTTLSNVSMVEPIGLAVEQGFNADLGGAGATVTVETQDAEGATATQTLQIGEPLENGNYVATSSESEYAVEIAPFTVEPLLTSARSDFLVQPEPTSALTDTSVLTDAGAFANAGTLTDTVLTTSVLTTTEAVSAAQDITPELGPSTDVTETLTSSAALTESAAVTGE